VVEGLVCPRIRERSTATANLAEIRIQLQELMQMVGLLLLMLLLLPWSDDR